MYLPAQSWDSQLHLCVFMDLCSCMCACAPAYISKMRGAERERIYQNHLTARSNLSWLLAESHIEIILTWLLLCLICFFAFSRDISSHPRNLFRYIVQHAAAAFCLNLNSKKIWAGWDFFMNIWMQLFACILFYTSSIMLYISNLSLAQHILKKMP